MNNREAHFYLEELQRMMTQHRDIFTEEFVCANGMAIQALEKAQEQRWIPVSERLPEDDYAVLVYEANHNNNFLAIYEDGRWKSFDPTYKATYFDETIYWHIIAWMPLPEPYKGGDAE